MWLRPCQSKRFCFISFVFATEAWSWREGRSGCKGGHCLIAGQDLFIPLDLLVSRLDGFDSKRKKKSLKDPYPRPAHPHPAPRSDILSGILSGYAKSIRLFQNSPTPTLGDGRMHCCPQSSGLPETHHAALASVCPFPLQQRRGWGWGGWRDRPIPFIVLSFLLTSPRVQKLVSQPGDADTSSVRVYLEGKLPFRNQMPTFPDSLWHPDPSRVLIHRREC